MASYFEEFALSQLIGFRELFVLPYQTATFKENNFSQREQIRDWTRFARLYKLERYDFENSLKGSFDRTGGDKKIESVKTETFYFWSKFKRQNVIVKHN